MPGRCAFEYAFIRVVPRVEREEFLNAGVVLYCRERRFLGASMRVDLARLGAWAPDLDLAMVAEQLALIPRICDGGAGAGPLGVLSQVERFRWLASPRSTVIQVSPVHSGLCEDPLETLNALSAALGS